MRHATLASAYRYTEAERAPTYAIFAEGRRLRTARILHATRARESISSFAA